MLTRRLFTGCALCAGLGLIAAGAEAQTAGVKREILRRQDLTGTNYECVLVRAEIAAGTLVARHTHPGIESSYVLSGGLTLTVAGQGEHRLAAGQGFQVPPVTPHSARGGEAPTLILVNYVVEKGKPLASPA